MVRVTPFWLTVYIMSEMLRAEKRYGLLRGFTSTTPSTLDHMLESHATGLGLLAMTAYSCSNELSLDFGTK